ncbi:Rha family transcriptional regulator [Paraburkholderia sp. MM5477-R1]|uniref:Rha family transcriptional regulator n=1 Tax=Paraburkholderia sp. MM5477-R1 TaxID=2991062 RepID=UPI003D19DDCD
MEQAQVLKPRVTLIDGQVMTTSLVITEHFGKRHGDVLKAIRNALREVPRALGARNFAETSYRDRSNRLRPMYRLTRDGFAYSAMSFTGKGAARWKVAYLDTFNAMEARLRQSSTCTENGNTAQREHGTISNPIQRGQPPLSP